MKLAKLVLACFKTKTYCLQSFPLIPYELLPIYQYEIFLFQELWIFPIQWTRWWALFSHTLSLGFSPTTELKIKQLLWSNSPWPQQPVDQRGVWDIGCGLEISAPWRAAVKRWQSQSSCLTNLVSTKCWQVCLAPAFHWLLYALCCEARKSWPRAYASLSYYCFTITLQLLLLIAKSSLHGCTTLSCKPEDMSQVSACQEEKKQF